ncbi:O-antigen ligase family protein, partial [Candidatus Roizmanbacteria bacterium]|nr:O-antigen ligase family protein [Candidatus Roizmanbacteria bacterium]
LLVYVFYFFYKKNLPRRVRLPILFISSLLILLSFSKVAVGVFILVNLLSLISRRSDDSCHICFLSRCVGFLTVGYLFFAFKTDPLTISNRLTLVKRAVQIVIAHPITGVGAGAYVIAQSAFSFSVWYLFNQPVHNIFLLVLAEHGLLVPLALLFLFRHQAIRFLKKYPYIALVIGITGLFDHYFLTLQQNLLLIGVVLGGL